MAYKKCERCGNLAYCNSEGYCEACESYRRASGYGASRVERAKCTKCGKIKDDCNSKGICGDCRRYYGI